MGTQIFLSQTRNADDAAVWQDVGIRRMASTPWPRIQQRYSASIPYTGIDLEELINRTLEQHTKCEACMIGKSTLEPYPERRGRADHPLKQVNVDSFPLSLQSIERYNHAVGLWIVILYSAGCTV